MQLYDRGLRRRLPTMLGGDQQRLRMAYSLMYAMPGTPTLFYGEEIGMGENLAIDGRLSVRTPMQWTSAPDAGFTTAPPDAAVRPFPAGDYGPEAINVATQKTDPESLLNWFERLIRLRKAAPEIGWGEYRVLDGGEDAVLVLEYRWDDRTTITVHNLAAKATTVSIVAGKGASQLRDRFGSSAPTPVQDGAASVKVAAHGYLWFAVESDA
jgi:glycosidase